MNIYIYILIYIKVLYNSKNVLNEFLKYPFLFRELDTIKTVDTIGYYCVYCVYRIRNTTLL